MVPLCPKVQYLNVETFYVFRYPKVSHSDYSVPDNFQERNLALILSIRKFLNNDESKFNEFKNYSAQFRRVLAAHSDHELYFTPEIMTSSQSLCCIPPFT